MKKPPTQISSTPLGPAGHLAALFTNSKLTPLIILAALLLGVMALWLTPREEEPQILVPMIDILIPMPGASPQEIEHRITIPFEKHLWGIPDVEYIYSSSFPGASLMTLRFKVGTELEPAVVRVHHKLREYSSDPNEPQPLVRSYTIDDVPFMALTFHGASTPSSQLRKIAKTYSDQLASISDVSKAHLIGGEPRQIKIYPNTQKLEEYHLSLSELFSPLKSGNTQKKAGTTEGKQEWIVEVHNFFKSVEEISDVVVGIKGGRAVRLKDVAQVVDGPAEPINAVRFVKKGFLPEQAVTLALAKRPGTNATFLANQVQDRLDQLKHSLPPNVNITITRNYGKTAKENSDDLIKHLLIASVSVVGLIALALGIRFALVVGIAVPVTLALTLLIYYMFGYTLNRVTLFALIFSIGILVDDAIVVIENIHRHLQIERNTGKSLWQIIIDAVNEVGNPTILATVTVIAAILPMAFVSGLMGPYMRPIPVGASFAMIFSLIVAFTITPWGAFKTHRNFLNNHTKSPPPQVSKLDQLYRHLMGALLDKKKNRAFFYGVIGLSFLFVGWLIADKIVRVKMLPFDNKSEFQVMIDLDQGNPLEATLAVAKKMGRYLETIPEVENYQIYAGTSAPINFNGLVRHYFLRQAPHLGDIQVNLIDRHHRSRQSHEIAKSVRDELTQIAKQHGARVKIVEIPPGPPVLSTMVAEIYAPTDDDRRELATQVKKIMVQTPGVVDVDWMVDHPQNKWMILVNRQQASLMQVPLDRIEQIVQTAVGGKIVGFWHLPEAAEEIPLMIRLPEKNRQDLKSVMNLKIPALDHSFIPLHQLARVVQGEEVLTLYRKNLQRVIYVTGELAGAEESPVYSLLQMNEKIKNLTKDSSKKVAIYSSQQPEIVDHQAIKWDGEWQISYEVFRDLGLAFAIVLVLIYILVVGWFQSFLTPLVIMIPIPLSLIGIIPGHWMFGAFFTATSMIGFIAGAGIIVRNSIILVDFIELRIKQGMPLHEAVVDAGCVRFKPMLLTAGAVIVGSFVILFDPIFQGLAISLMMGEVAATLLSRFAVPLLYNYVKSEG